MSAATADRNTVMMEGVYKSYPVAASTTIYAGTMVCVNASGYAVPAANTAGLQLVGVAREYVDNSSGSNGDLNVEVWRGRHVEMTISGAAITDVGRPVWVVDDQDVGLVKGDVFAGVIAEYVSATSVILDILPAAQARPVATILSIPVKMAKVADGDVVTTYTPGFPGTITKVSFVVTDPVTTAAKATTLNLEIGTTNLTGGVLSLTSANCTPLGKVIDATAITAGNRFTAADTISVEASSTTPFAEGEGVLLITIV